MSNTLPNRHPRWSKTERHLYGGQAYRALGEVDRSGAMLVEILTGPLTLQRRWFTTNELCLPPLLTTETPPDATTGSTASVSGACGTGSPIDDHTTAQDATARQEGEA